jgi:glucose/arabinose dehydrogenase
MTMTGFTRYYPILLLLGLNASPCLLAEDAIVQPARHVFPSLGGNIVAERVLDGLSEPVAIEFLPDGKALVLQRDRGLITLADFKTGEKTDISGLPKLVVFSAAGVHDVELHPDFAQNGWIYITYSEGVESYSTVVLDRFRLEGSKAVDIERLFTADAYSEGAYHFAARIQFVDGDVFVSIGPRAPAKGPGKQQPCRHRGAHA